ncbi:MAG: nucleotidyltransferase domain-containing protein [Candidatus Margulisbacteria bacterium]|nr:nucleotidyltransferase domain-containing protein [Candidatus Margulisiibacteriota bacterium]MBU1616454.1 nucleotidyltransferase domain-containing protein [Candidatus Margulisiibacteriota bacterium]
MEKELNSFVDKAKQKYQPKKIVLFGSMAGGKVNEKSDIDVLMIAESKSGFWERMKEVSGISSRLVGMDILFYTPGEYIKLINNRTFIRNEIEEKGKIIYESKSA